MSEKGKGEDPEARTAFSFAGGPRAGSDQRCGERAWPGLAPIGLAALALAARVGFGVIYWGEAIWATDLAFAEAQGGDPSKYAEIIRNILDGRGFLFDGRPSARVGPMLPYVLAGVFGVLGTNFWSLLVANGVFGALAAVAVWRMALVLSGDPRAAGMAGLLVAFNPGLLHWSAMLMTEGLCIALLAWGILSGVQYVQTRKVFHMGVAGVLVGLAALTRAEVLATGLLLPLAVWLRLRRAGAGQAGRATLVFLAAIAFTLLPWTVRNYSVFGVLLPVSGSGGVALLHGNGPQYAGVGVFDPQVWRLPPEDMLGTLNRYDLIPGVGTRFNRMSQETEVEQRGKAWGLALAYIRERPGEYARRCLGRLMTLWLPWTSVMSPRHRLAKAVLWLVLVPVGVWGAWRARGLPLAVPVVVPIVATTLVLTAILLDPALAYRTLAEPFLGVFAGWGWIALFERCRRRDAGTEKGRNP